MNTHKDKGVLKKIIEKAQKNGYKGGVPLLPYANLTLFSHDFAMAFFGDDIHDENIDYIEGHYKCFHCKGESLYGPDYCWQYHLQQMVIAKDPIKYLEQFL